MVLKLVALVSAAALTLAGCGSEPAKESAPPPPTTTTTTTTQPTTTTETAPPTAADGTNLAACADGVCEVEVKLGDVIQFNGQVKSTPPLTSLTVIEMGPDGPMLADPSGFASTVNGSITMNDVLNIETLYADGTRALLKLSLA